MLLTEFIKRLSTPKDGTPSREHDRLVEHVVGLRKISSGEMSKNYGTWDYHDKVFRGERPVDKDDRNAASKGQPAKLTVPLTQSQILTFVAFNTSVLGQNRRFYELEPTGTEDNPLREPLELIVERDLRRNTWQAHLIQWFLDIGRFSLAVAECGWMEKTRMMKLQKTEEVEGAFGAAPTMQTTDVYTEVPVFCGNKVYPVSPYKFFPDTRLPLTRFQEGEFCGHEESFSMQSLRGTPGLINTDRVPKMTEDMYKDRRSSTRIPELETRANPNQGSTTGERETLDEGAYVKTGTVLVTKMIFDLVPKDFKVDGDSIGAQDFTLRFVCWIGNDQTILRFEEATFLHGQFPYSVGQFLPDQHRTVNMSLAESCDALTSLISWLFNAHVTAQRNVIKGGKFLVDPAGVDIRGLDSDSSPYIMLKKNASQTGVDRYIKQFQITDPTQSFMADAAAIKSLLGEVTGYNETMAGQYSSGRRSATADRVVAQNGSARGKSTLGGIWDTLFEPLGRQLISLNRQEMDEETFWRVVGSGMKAEHPDLFTLFKADPVAIVCAEDFFVFDATIPSEKAFLAQSLQEVLLMMMQNPQVAQIMGYGPEQFKAILQDVYNLRGVTPSRLPAPTQPTQAAAPGIIPMPQAEPAVPALTATSNGS
jgi:hypothetical protein